jgi:hypothetical protein
LGVAVQAADRPVSAEDALGLCPRKTEKVKPRDVQKVALRIRKEVSTVTTNAANTNVGQRDRLSAQ